MLSINDIVYNQGYKKYKKIELLQENFPEEYSCVTGFVNSIEGILSCFRNKIFEQPICQHPDCNEPVKMTKGFIFPRGCCLVHSQEITFLENYGVVNPMMTSDVQERVKHTTLERFGVDNVFKLVDIQEKIKQTNLKKYGVECSFQNTEIKERIRQTNQQKYGTDNPMQNEDVARKTSETHKQKHKEYQPRVEQTNLEKYGVKNPLENNEIHRKSVLTKRYNNYYYRILQFPNIEPLFVIDEYHGSDKYNWRCKVCDDEFSFIIEDGKIPVCRKCNPFERNPFSKGEKELSEWLKSLGLTIEENNRTILDGKELDIYIPEKNIAIEFNGIYWHSELNGKGRNYHLDKTTICSEKDIQLIHLFDVDWYQKQNLVKSMLMTKLGLIKDRIFARKCEIKEITSKEKNDFLMFYHLNGSDRAKIKIGLFYDGLLMSVMTFSKPRFDDNKYEWEIHRFANKTNMSIIGGAGKLFNYFVEKYQPESIISYSDKNWFTGSVYEKLGMVRLEDTPPAPYYFKNPSEGLIHRLSLQKHMLKSKLEFFDSNLTAWENLQIAGYDRIWDCGNYKFEWRKFQ